MSGLASGDPGRAEATGVIGVAGAPSMPGTSLSSPGPVVSAETRPRRSGANTSKAGDPAPGREPAPGSRPGPVAGPAPAGSCRLGSSSAPGSSITTGSGAVPSTVPGTGSWEASPWDRRSGPEIRIAAAGASPGSPGRPSSSENAGESSAGAASLPLVASGAMAIAGGTPASAGRNTSSVTTSRRGISTMAAVPP